ncbi:phosphopantetheine-binding protein [Streptomyces sp. LZ34]
MTDAWDPQFESIMRETLRFLPDDEELEPDLNTSSAGLDSVASVELLVAVEGAFGIVVPDELIVPETFATPAGFWKVIHGLLNADDAA